MGSTRNDDKDSLNGESANLPQGWTIKTLGEIAHTTSGGTPSRKNLDYWNGNIKWLKSGELNDDYINEVEESITQIGLEKSSAKIFPKGTLLIALYGATIGKLGILNIETATNQAICAITPNKDFEAKYLFHFLFSIRDKMIQDAFGGAQSNISQTYLKQLKIPIPPLEIQKQIVAILERHFTSADKVSAYIDSCLSKAKQLKSSLLKSAFAGTLTNESTHPLTPSAQGGGIRKMQSAMEGEHYSCHTERSEVSKNKSVDLQNHLDSSVAPLPQNDKVDSCNDDKAR